LRIFAPAFTRRLVFSFSTWESFARQLAKQQKDLLSIGARRAGAIFQGNSHYKAMYEVFTSALGDSYRQTFRKNRKSGETCIPVLRLRVAAQEPRALEARQY